MAAARAAGLESVDPLPEIGTEISLAGFKAVIAEGQAKLTSYNTLLAEVDEAQNVLDAAEKKIGDYSSRFLAAIAAKFGRDSNEYEMAGGTRTSEHRRRSTPAPATPLSKAA